MSRARKVTAAAAAALLAILAVIAVALGTMMSAMLGADGDGAEGDLAAMACAPILPGSAAEGLALEPVQLERAAQIIAVGKQLDIPPRGWVVAIATAMQESTLRNLASQANPASTRYPNDGVAAGDHDSVGLFQQRNGWGSVGARMNPLDAARMFFTGGAAGQRGLLDVPFWQNMGIAQAAQAVQVSAFPMAYSQWEQIAVDAVENLGNVTVDAGCANIAAGPWTSPVPMLYRLTAGFGQCSGLWSNCHTGTDLAAITGTVVVAASVGEVVSAGEGGAYGNLVKIRHADGVQTWYAHLSAFTVAAGDQVRAGDQVGNVGQTGNTTGPHLHFEVRVNDEPVDAVPFMADKGVDL